MAHGVEVRVPFVDFVLLEAIGPAIASVKPPNKSDLASCSDQIARKLRASQNGFSTPVRRWIADHDVAARVGACAIGPVKSTGVSALEAGTQMPNYPIRAAA